MCVGVLDVLCSMATYRYVCVYFVRSLLAGDLAKTNVQCYLSLSVCGEAVMCRPRVLPPTAEGKPFLRIVSGRHPCVTQTYFGEEFIPNDMVIEGEHLCTVVTGPNMGGKSTLMRQTGLIVILAQLVSTSSKFCRCKHTGQNQPFSCFINTKSLSHWSINCRVAMFLLLVVN